MWWVWVLGGLAVWMVVAVVFGVLIGRGIRRADMLEGRTEPLSGLIAGKRSTAPQPAPVLRRRAIPVPTFGLALFGLAVVLETGGYVVRLTGAENSLRALSMDAPFSLPRMYVAALFAAAAMAAVAGAGVHPGRRTWWTTVALVGGGIAAVKAGGTVHADAFSALSGAVGGRGALLVSVLLAGAVLAVLGFLSRTERRDRRRVLGVLAFYGIASVGLSALSGVAAGAAGVASSWAVGATFIEESGEALAGVAFLLAVLAGVAPRLVLPGAWALRRSADVLTLELPERVPGGSAPEIR
ncbi:hypothetical protein E4P40_02020 [Blastococcus sp. CT_GayMR20]|uniref:hypothetical protein n=1 Tax=Blastococcus sp. CT_GayMR20 TaxID=2559609 RepID=UPI0010741473|nr:hypothetical protein [Blastococcus sp. CT_GayMR20]TFV92695.1 hypothetical protein E4P40_01840 [Blastococcus sp. CT_GayMR20]TFV92724.1 hypothetical protein E4P40_02020 [Blastococcus sp. CT_GayMR20]